MRTIGICSIALIVAAGSACSEPTVGPPLSPTQPSGVSLQTIAVSGPHRILPGATGQFTAIGTYSDGTTKDLTHDAIWSSFDSDPRSGPATSHDVLQIDGTGLVQPRTVGQAVVYAQVDQRRSAPYDVMTFDEGTFAVWGVVQDGNNPLHASVEVTAGTRSGLFVWSNDSRGFVLYGLSGPTTLRLAADGFAARTLDLNVDRSGALADLELAPASTPVDLAGSWDITFQAPSSCGAVLGDPVTTRTGWTFISQSGTFFNASWHPAGLTPAFDTSGRVIDRTINFTFTYDYGRDSYIWAEGLPNKQYLAINGTFEGEGTIDGAGASGRFRGDFLLFSNYYAMWDDAPIAKCSGTDGSFKMTRRPI